jgi:hypothetical protein
MMMEDEPVWLRMMMARSMSNRFCRGHRGCRTHEQKRDQQAECFHDFSFSAVLAAASSLALSLAIIPSRLYRTLT